MECANCKFRWCWVCGTNVDSCLHKFMNLGCQLTNMGMVMNCPTFIKCILIPIFLIVGIPLFIFLITLFSVIQYIKEFIFNTFTKCISDQSIKKLFCQQRCEFHFGLFVALPVWIFLIAIGLTISSIILCVLIVPYYLLAIYTCIKMSIWWCKNRRIEKENQLALKR